MKKLMLVLLFSVLFLFCWPCISLPVFAGAAVQEESDATRIDVLDLKTMDILDVLKLISKKTGKNIMASQNVQGRVSVFLRDVDVEEALTIILDAYDWAYKVNAKGIIHVMTAKEFEDRYHYIFGQKNETHVVRLKYARPDDLKDTLSQIKSTNGKVIVDQKSNSLILIDKPSRLYEMEQIVESLDIHTETAVFDLSYANAEQISGKIDAVLTPNIGKMNFDQRSNKVVVHDTAETIHQVQAIIDEFDEKDQAVYIQAKILQIVLSDDFKLGVDWEAVITDFNEMNLSSNFDVLNTMDKSGLLSVGSIDADDYSVFVEVLNTIGETEILSSPHIVTVNNKEAKILVGSNEPYVTTTTTTPATGASTTAESVNFIEVGVKLYVTPTIHKDDYITLAIKPEVSSVTSNLTTGNNNTIPIVETSEAETTVLVKNGVTLVIGGLIKEENIDDTKKIPLLGDIPFFGAAFRSQRKYKEKQEIVIFLTPNIVSGDSSDFYDAPDY